MGRQIQQIAHLNLDADVALLPVLITCVLLIRDSLDGVWVVPKPTLLVGFRFKTQDSYIELQLYITHLWDRCALVACRVAMICKQPCCGHDPVLKGGEWCRDNKEL